MWSQKREWLFVESISLNKHEYRSSVLVGFFRSLSFSRIKYVTKQKNINNNTKNNIARDIDIISYLLEKSYYRKLLDTTYKKNILTVAANAISSSSSIHILKKKLYLR